MSNYFYLGKTDVSFIKKQLEKSNNSIWNIETSRQKTYDVHKHTETINLLWSLNSLSNPVIENNKTKEYYFFDIDNFLKNIKNFYIKRYGKGSFKRILLTKLKAKSNIDIHQDLGKSLENCFRTHIPIITNDEVYFFVDGEKKNMKIGEIWEIDNKKPHMVKNQSNFDRIHLIIDYDILNLRVKYF